MTYSVTCIYLQQYRLDYHANQNFGAGVKYRYPLTTSELAEFRGEQSWHVDWMKQIPDRSVIVRKVR
jgi:hypothetical protein